MASTTTKMMRRCGRDNERPPLTARQWRWTNPIRSTSPTATFNSCPARQHRILDQLVLENVGTFRGRHVIDLTPPSPAKPIVLIGGLNGAGKTTVLEAIQLALYVGPGADVGAARQQL